MFRVKELPIRSVEWLCTHRNDIDHEPVYQRKGHIWSTADKALLIDSILNDYDIPKIYVADFTSVRSPLNDKKKRYAVIDGKQRLEAVMEFFDGKLKLDSGFQYAKDASLELGGRTIKELSLLCPELVRKFYNYQLAVMGVTTDEEGKINDLFIRLNRSKPLVGAEIRNAMLGKVPPLIRELSSHKFFKSRIAFKSNRMQDQNAAAKILLLEFRGKFVDTKKSQLDAFVEDGIQSQSSLSQISAKNFRTTVQRCRSVLNNMVLVFKEHDPLFRSQGPLTVYYWFVKEHAAQKKFIRKFLIEFEAIRQANRKRASEQPPPNDLDTELLSFDFLNRSPNDQASCVRRYAILESRFEAFLKQKPIVAEQIPLIEKI
jgi:hypothetical protein